jgi:hypothetical protein
MLTTDISLRISVTWKHEARHQFMTIIKQPNCKPWTRELVFVYFHYKHITKRPIIIITYRKLTFSLGVVLARSSDNLDNRVIDLVTGKYMAIGQWSFIIHAALNSDFFVGKFSHSEISCLQKFRFLFNSNLYWRCSVLTFWGSFDRTGEDFTLYIPRLNRVSRSFIFSWYWRGLICD